MGKLGPAKYRIMVAILASCYVILSILAILCCIFYFSGGFLVVQIINLAIGCLGLFSLYREHDVLMKVYGIITIIAAVVQVLLLVAVIVASCYREALTDEALKDLMVHYYLSDDDRETVDAIQEAYKCCGSRSFMEWPIKPYSCCATSDCYTYYTDGCITALSSLTYNICLVAGSIIIVSIIVHIYAVVSSFELSKAYSRRPIRPRIQHSI